MLEDVADGLSHAEITRACDDAAKHAVLDGSNKIDTPVIVSMLEERKRSQVNA